MSNPENRSSTACSDRRARDRELLACDFVAECAHKLVMIGAALLAAASAGEVAAVEAQLWQLRRALAAAIQSWREAVPPLESDGDAR